DFGLALLAPQPIVGLSVGALATLPGGPADDATLREGTASEPGPERTEPGALLGAPLYLAPELWRGAAPTPASDVYAMGAVLYELLSGLRPHEARSMGDLRRRVLEEPIVPLAERRPEVPPELDALVNGCLRADPVLRPAADEVREALEALHD